MDRNERILLTIPIAILPRAKRSSGENVVQLHRPLLVGVSDIVFCYSAISGIAVALDPREVPASDDGIEGEGAPSLCMILHTGVKPAVVQSLVWAKAEKVGHEVEVIFFATFSRGILIAKCVQTVCEHSVCRRLGH